MNRRPSEAAYVRFILDEHFAESLRAEPDKAHALGLNEEEQVRLLAIPVEALRVERRGRQGSLWERIRGHLPATIRYLELHLSHDQVLALRREYFATTFWDFDLTLDLRPYGQGWEMASTFAAFLDQNRRDQIFDLAADLATYERLIFETRVEPASVQQAAGPRAVQQATHETNWDIFAVAADPRLSPEEVALVHRQRYTVAADGAVQLLSDEAVELAENVMTGLSSYRLDHYHASSTMYFPLGRRAETLNAQHQALQEAVTAKIPSPDTAFEPCGAGYLLRDEDYFIPTPSVLCGEDEVLVIERRDGSERLRIPLDTDRLDGLHRLLSHLQATRSLADVRGALGADFASFLDQLREIGFIVPRLHRCPPIRKDYRATFIGHSGVLIETPSTRVMVDPLLVVRNRPQFNPLRAVLGTDLDAVVITHSHWDHLNLDSLLHLNPDTTIIVPARRNPDSIVNPNIGQMVRDLGFSRVIELTPWDSYTLGTHAPEGETIEVSSLPYYGETTGPQSPRDWQCARIASGGRELLFLVDAAADAFGSTDDVVHASVSRFGPVDILFTPCSDFRYPVRNYTRRPFFMGPGLDAYTGSPFDAARWATISGAQVVVPYALFHLMPGDVANEPAACDAEPFRFGGLRELAEVVPPFPRGSLCLMEPGDRLAWGDKALMGVPDLTDGMTLIRGGGR